MAEQPKYSRDYYPPRREWDVVKIIGVLVAAVLVVGGLFVLGSFVLFVVAMGNFGSNK